MFTVKMLKEMAVLLGKQVVFYLSQDDKARVPLGLPAANKQSCLLMHMQYRVSLPDHDWVVAEKHKLIPSVYACTIVNEKRVSYSGPTYIAIRSGKHDSSTAITHADDFEHMVDLEMFNEHMKTSYGTVKPVIVVNVDGGPDENPRYPKTCAAWVHHFKKYEFDAIFIATHAPGQSHLHSMLLKGGWLPLVMH